MGNNPTFTKEQRYVIDKIKDEGTFTSLFYFTGGTALSYIYLHHRQSEDLDFFTEKNFNKDGGAWQVYVSEVEVLESEKLFSQKIQGKK